MTTQNNKLIVEAFMNPHEAVASLLDSCEPKYVFGKEAIKSMLAEYKTGFAEFSFMNADLFIRNLYHNLRELLNIEKDVNSKVNCDSKVLALINKYLKDLGIEYHFSMIGYGFGDDYLRCDHGYSVSEG